MISGEEELGRAIETAGGIERPAAKKRRRYKRSPRPVGVLRSCEKGKGKVKWENEREREKHSSISIINLSLRTKL